MEEPRKTKILYLHGLASSPAGTTPKNLRAEFPDFEIVTPEVPIRPKEAYAFIKENYGDAGWDDDFDLVMGTSLGGFYALCIPLARKLIINPAMFVDEDIKKNIGLGEKEFLSARSNGDRTYMLDESFIEELAWIREKIYKDHDIWYPDKMDVNECNCTYAAFAKNDDLLGDGHYDDFCKLFLPEHAYRVSGGHHMTAEVLHNEIAPLIRKILAEKRKPQVFVMDDDWD